MSAPHFDRLAPWYAALEAVSFGGRLQWCRTALLADAADARRVLILGEGDGRYLAALLAANPAATVDVIDGSPAMVALARRRAGAAAGRVTWHVADARHVAPPSPPYDLVVTNFFLDCFDAGDLEPLVAKFAGSLAPGGLWVVGDFRVPPGRLRGLLGRGALATMYAFFRLTTRLPAGRLVDPNPLLHAAGLTLVRERCRLGGFLTASLWRASSGPG